MAFSDLWRLLFHPDEVSSDDPLLARWEALEADLLTLDVWDLPSVVAARGLAADISATLPMYPVRNGRRIDTPAVLERPDPAEPYRTTIERMVNGLTGPRGRTWLHITARSASTGWPLAVEVVDDERVNVDLHPDTQRIRSMTVDGRNVELRDYRLCAMSVDHRHPLGVSPLERIRVNLELFVEVLRFSSSYYTTAAVPPYAVISETRLRSTQSAELQQAWIEARARRRPPVLSGKLALQTYTGVSAADALLMEAVEYFDAVVSRVMQMPPSLLNVASQNSLTYSTVVGEAHRWLLFGLHPMFLRRIEATFSDLMPRGVTVEFDTDAFTTLDTDTDTDDELVVDRPAEVTS